MAKAKKGKAAGGAERPTEMQHVSSKVRQINKYSCCNTAGDALDGLNGYVGWLVMQATKRASENGRKTVRAHDFGDHVEHGGGRSATPAQVIMPLYLVSACSSPEQFVAAFRRYIDRIGLFVPIAVPLAAGKRGRIAITLADGGVMLEGDAEIVSSSTRASALYGRVGMTLRFTHPDEPTKVLLEESARAHRAQAGGAERRAAAVGGPGHAAADPARAERPDRCRERARRVRGGRGCVAAARRAIGDPGRADRAGVSAG